MKLHTLRWSTVAVFGVVAVGLFGRATRAEPPAIRNLSPQFCILALRALDVIVGDSVSVDISKATPATDRIAEAEADAHSAPERAFVVELHHAYTSKVMENLLTRIVNLSSHIDVEVDGYYKNSQEYEQQIADGVSENRNLATMRLRHSDCFVALRAALKTSSFIHSPVACAHK